MHVVCLSQNVVVLVGFQSSDKVLLFPSQSTKFPGLHFENRALVPIHDQISEYLEHYFSRTDLRSRFELDPFFAETLKIDDKEATLYLGIIKNAEEPLPRYLQTLPILIRGMEKNKTRLAYLKAWQILSGAREQEIRAVEVKS